MTRVFRRRGVVLVDAVVGAILMGLALAGVLVLGGRAITAQTEGEQLRAAAMLIDERLNLVLMLGVEGYRSKFDTSGECDAPFENYTYEVNIGGGQSGRPYDVSVTVSWMSGGRERSETVRTMIAARLGEEPDPIRKPSEVINRLP